MEKPLKDSSFVQLGFLKRRKEPIFINEYKGKKFTDAQWIKILSENPVLIERPIVIDGAKAVIGRPPLLILKLLKAPKKSK